MRGEGNRGERWEGENFVFFCNNQLLPSGYLYQPTAVAPPLCHKPDSKQKSQRGFVLQPQEGWELFESRSPQIAPARLGGSHLWAVRSLLHICTGLYAPYQVKAVPSSGCCRAGDC